MSAIVSLLRRRIPESRRVYIRPAALYHGSRNIAALFSAPGRAPTHTKPMWTRFKLRYLNPITDPTPVIMLDFDGVVADSLEIFHTEFAAACRELGYDQLSSKEALLKLFEGNIIREIIRAGFPVRRLKQLAIQFAPRIQEANRHVQAFPGMPEVVSDLAAAFPLYVISSNQTRSIEDFIDRHAITGVREVIGADKESSKVKKIRRVMALHPGRACYYVGDTKGDMIEAHAARVTSVAAAWGWHSPDKLGEADPHHMLHSPQELHEFFHTRTVTTEG